MTEAGDQAEKIARAMLLNSITESAMSKSMGRCRQGLKAGRNNDIDQISTEVWQY